MSSMCWRRWRWAVRTRKPRNASGLKAVTVKSYLQNAMAKLSAHNRLEAVSAARRLGLIP